ncbi:hypothetical protein IX39_16915 [Chryseobacterium formosense]|uniref:DUF1294 domain-containing protein n=1 Tax=Chryseobacterium formosense TaxID=236814 RepID=A0A085Z0W3_9FLAO|nr:DUF1294 domain-containing protein [Chryseobacterium formosense]KFE98076.1 hypothetical protein IX39_16915 [Chryseobacterium formosense]SFT72834.1 Uncharacterized membrane protein YsdA, DUF1294 family [Chryseobacterium formosense]
MLYFLLIINLITFIIFSLDKWKATKHKRRISEFNLLILTFFGGTAGAISAMLIFRHKISKRSFLWKFFGIILLQILIVVGYTKFLPENLNLL